MKTAQSEAERINKEIETKMGGTSPEVVPPAESNTPPVPPVTSPPAEPPKKVEVKDEPPRSPTPPATPPPVVATPPATPPPVAAAPPVPAPPPPTPATPEPEKDYKQLYEQTQAQKPKQAQAYKTMQSLWQQSGNRVSELEAENAALRAQPPTPDPVEQVPPPAPAENNGAVDKFLDQMREDYGQDYVTSHESFIRKVAAEAVKSAVDGVQTDYEKIKGQLNDTRRQQTLDQNQVFESEVYAAHQDWEQILADDTFKTWLLEHPHGELFYPLVYPENGQLSMTSGETNAILKEFKQVSPAFQDQAAQTEESKRRLDAAAQSDQGDIHTAQPEVLTQGEYILLSDIPKMQRKLGNNPKALMEYNAKVEAAQAAGMLVNDNLNSPFLGGVTP